MPDGELHDHPHDRDHRRYRLPGEGLGYRFAPGGHKVLLGSRDADRAIGAAEVQTQRLPSGGRVVGLEVTGGSAAERAASLLSGSTVVRAFHHLAAVILNSSAQALDEEDVLVCGDDRDVKDIVIALASTIVGKPGIDAGRLRLARQLEPLTAVLISINKRYKTHSEIAISGISREMNLPDSA